MVNRLIYSRCIQGRATECVFSHPFRPIVFLSGRGGRTFILPYSSCVRSTHQKWKRIPFTVCTSCLSFRLARFIQNQRNQFVELYQPSREYGFVRLVSQEEVSQNGRHRMSLCSQWVRSHCKLYTKVYMASYKVFQKLNDFGGNVCDYNFFFSFFLGLLFTLNGKLNLLLIFILCRRQIKTQ